jgi:hypothetical protein
MNKRSVSKIVALITMATMLWSCGDSKKKNTVNGNGSGISLPTSPIGSGQTQVSAQNYSSILNQVQCRTGNFNGFRIGNRLQTVYTFHTTGNTGGNGSQTTISGSFSPGGVGGSDVSRVYLGVGYYGDVMLVQKVVQGSQVVGYNVMVSYCSMTSSNGAPYISDSRPISSFQGTITIDDEVSCGHGMIDYSSTRAVSQTDPNYSYLPAFNADTVFTKVGCVNF